MQQVKEYMLGEFQKSFNGIPQMLIPEGKLNKFLLKGAKKIMKIKLRNPSHIAIFSY